MKKVTLAMIIVWSIVGIFLVGALVYGLVNRGSFVPFWNNSSAREVIFDQSFNVEDFDNIILSMTSDETKVFVTDEDFIRVVQYGINLNENRKIKVVSQNRRELNISGSNFSVNFFSFGFNYSRSFVEIYIPESYNGKLDVSLTSGLITFEDDIDIADLDIRISSGTVRSDYAINVSNRTNIRVTSGTIKLYGGLNTDRYNISVSSGTINIDKHLIGSGNLSTSSGMIKAYGVDITEELSAKVTSGMLTLGVVNDALDFDATVSSGLINTYFLTQDEGKRKTASFGDAPRKKLEVSVNSGTLRIEKY